MTIKRKQLLDSLICKIDKPDNYPPVAYIHGGFGVGKSEFLADYLTSILKTEFADAVCHFNFNVEHNFLVNYLTSFDLKLPGTDDTDVNYNFDECSFNKQNLTALLEKVYQSDIKTYNLLLNRIKPVFYNQKSKKEISDNELSEKLNEIFDKKSDRRFLLHHDKVIAESLIVDLMNLFYPLTKEYPNHSAYLNKIESPIRVIIIIDNIDKLTYSITKWLNDALLPLCLEGKFGDFLAYDIDETQKDINISRFIDFKFIISSRNNILKFDGFDYFASLKEKIYQVELKEYDYDETCQYLNERDVDGKYYDLLYSFSTGLRFLIDMLLEYNIDEINEVVRDTVYDKFVDKLLDNQSLQQAEAIKMAAYLDFFESDALRCNAVIGDAHKDIFQYLKYLNGLFVCEKDRICIKESIRTVLTKSMERNEKSKVLEYKNISSKYYEVKKAYPKLSSEELNIFRSLAYFEHFDMEMAINMAFDDKSSEAKSFIKNNPELFDKHNFTKSVKSSHRILLDSFNKLIDKNKYEMKKQLLATIWQEREKELKQEQLEVDDNLEQLSAELKKYGDDPNQIKQKYDNQQKEFIEMENELIKLRKASDSFSYSRYISSLIVNITASIMSFIIGYFFPELFSTPHNHSSVIIIQYVLYFISIVFLFMGLNFAFRIIRLKRNSNGLLKIQEKIDNLNNEKSELREKMRESKDIFSNWQKKVNELSTKIKQAESRKKELVQSLNESYI